MTIFEFCAAGSLAISALGLLVTIMNNWDIRVVHRATNSMKDELVRSTKTASEAIGEARGRQLQRENHQDEWPRG